MQNRRAMVTNIVVLIVGLNYSGLNSPLIAQEQSTGAVLKRFQAELIEGDPTKGLILNVTYYGNLPTSNQAEKSLRLVLDAASIIHSDVDITAKAWHSKSAESDDRSAITLSNGVDSLFYSAKDKAIRSAEPSDAKSGDKDNQSDDIATIMKDSKVVKTCKDVSQENLSILASLAIEKRGQERKFIVKVMRDWCKENDVELSRKMRVCMSSISKAIVAMPTTTEIEPADLAEVLALGKKSFEGDNHCSRCHAPDGRGGSRGPDLTDDEWDHCDGSIEGIKKVILSGVPLNKLKDSTRTIKMSAYKELKNDKKQLNDLAVYVHSLSQN